MRTNTKFLANTLSIKPEQAHTGAKVQGSHIKYHYKGGLMISELNGNLKVF